MMLLAFVGLATDTGILYVAYGQLRRAVDSAALGAATQVREATKTQDQVTDMARQYIQLQGFEATSITVETCSWVFGRVPEARDVNLDVNNRFVSFKPDAPTDTVTSPAGRLYKDEMALCTYPVSKKVRVEAAAEVQTAFLHIVGWNNLTLHASAVTEAASLEIVLILDTSYSMTYDAAISNGKDDDGDGCVDEQVTPIVVLGHLPGSATACSDSNGKNDDWLRDIQLSNTLAYSGTYKNQPECNFHVPGDTRGDPDISAVNQIISKLPPNYPLGSTYSSGTRLSPGHICMPFEYVRNAAINFVNTYVNFPYDRVAIITFSNLVGGDAGIGVEGLNDNKAATLQHLQANDTHTLSGGRTGSFITIGTNYRFDVSPSPDCSDPNIPDWEARPGKCEATNTGGALAKALTILSSPAIRQNALRFVILLSDGAASTSNPNVTTAVLSGNTPTVGDNGYACPTTPSPDGAVSFGDPNKAKYDQYFYRRNCQDGNVEVKHDKTSNQYDADDYARDQAFALGSAGKNIIVFTIGLGDAVTENPGTGNPTKPQPSCASPMVLQTTPGFDILNCNADSLPNGEQLLRYIADQGDGDNIFGVHPCTRVTDTIVGGVTKWGFRYEYPIGQSCGNYYYAQGGLDLEKVFEAIASRIFTRVTQ